MTLHRNLTQNCPRGRAENKQSGVQEGEGGKKSEVYAVYILQ